MPSHDFSRLLSEISARRDLVNQYLHATNTSISFEYKHLEDAVYSYIDAGGKALRAAVMMFCCGAVGGDEESALPAAAAIELYHTFTLVHDDIIDRDQMRRGVPTVHFDFATRGAKELQLDKGAADHYGLAIAILAGDMQQGWAASLLPHLYLDYGLPPELALNLIAELFRRIQITLINGETLDILQAETPVEQVSEEDVINMLWQKTGVLYEFAGRAGAAIGLKEPNLQHPTIQNIAEFTGKCGIAFQIQDDVLGLIGSEAQLGKAVGADIREGKRTVIVLHSLKQMTPAQRAFALSVLGNQDASSEDIQELTGLIETCGGISHAQSIAKTYIDEAIQKLEILPESPYKSLLTSWAEYIIARKR
jgi:geranylgeranyl diphosphate synthase type I